MVRPRDGAIGTLGMPVGLALMMPGGGVRLLLPDDSQAILGTLLTSS